MKNPKIALVGSTGKMGREILILAARDKRDIRHLVSNKKSSDKKMVELKRLSGKEVDLLIDFSAPEMMSEALAWCVKNKIAFVSGTTGISPSQEKELVAAAKSIPVFWASNFSVGIALMTEMLSVFSQNNAFDFQIEEVHHRHKKDSPSGTAKSLQSALKKIIKKDLPEPVAIRGGEIFGIHKVWAMSSTENITIEHCALNRSVFAEGALRAGLWLVDQKPGKYSMQDLLGASHLLRTHRA